MALDGFSIKQVGLGQDNTSAQMARATEAAIKTGLKGKSVSNIEKTSDTDSVQVNKDGKGQGQAGGRQRPEGDQDNTENLEEGKTAYVVDVKGAKPRDLEYYKQFSDKLAIRMNKRTESIELYDKDSKKTVETISAEDLIKLIEHLKISSGVLVNRKI